MSWSEYSKIDYSLIVMFFNKLITVMFTLCLLIVFFCLFIMLYVFLLLPFLWWNKDVYICFALYKSTHSANNVFANHTDKYVVKRSRTSLSCAACGCSRSSNARGPSSVSVSSHTLGRAPGTTRPPAFATFLTLTVSESIQKLTF